MPRLRSLLFTNDEFTAARIGDEDVMVIARRLDRQGFVTELHTDDGRRFFVVRRHDGVWVRESV